MTTEANADLVTAHARVHAWLEDSTYAMIEALVQLRIDDARARFAQLARLLREHMAFEEREVMPVYESVAPADGPGRADHVQGDHVILLRHIDAIDAVLTELDGASLRDVVTRLPVAYRLIATLEHHTAREQANVYPALARALHDDEARRHEIAQALLDLVARA